MQRLSQRRRFSVVTFPTGHDDLTEKAQAVSTIEIDTPLGYWYTPGATLTLDTTHVVSGLRSIREYVDPDVSPTSPHDIHHVFTSPADLSKMEQVHFFHLCDEHVDPSMWQAILLDANGKTARVDFGTAANAWQEKLWNLSVFTPDSGFDWTIVHSITIANRSQVTDKSSQYVDDLYFQATVQDGVLRVESSPTGKTGNMTYGGTTYPFACPSQVTLPFGTQVTLTMKGGDFDHWQDTGSTDPTRVETIGQPTLTLTAIYRAAIAPKLIILSYDESGQSFPAQQAVKLIYAGIEQFVDVPFAGSLANKGSYSFVAYAPNDRTFDYWKMPDGSKVTAPYVTVDIQADTTLEVHWKKAGVIPGIPEIPLDPATIAILIGSVVVIYLVMK